MRTLMRPVVSVACGVAAGLAAFHYGGHTQLVSFLIGFATCAVIQVMQK